MIDQLLVRISPLSVAAFALVSLIARLLYNRYGAGLNNVPGPFFASFTNFYRLAVVRSYRPERWHISLHQKYGDLVRIGPRTVLCSSNKAAKKIYALNAGFVKVCPSLRSMRSLTEHAVRILRRAANVGERRPAEDAVHFN